MNQGKNDPNSLLKPGAFAPDLPVFCLFQTGTTFSKKLFYKIPSMKSSVMLKRTILPRNLVDRPIRSRVVLIRKWSQNCQNWYFLSDAHCMEEHVWKLKLNLP